MEVKRVPQSSGSQSVDPSGQTGSQEKKLPDREKKKKKGQSQATAPAAPVSADKPEAEWAEADLSQQHTDSETVADLLSHPPTVPPKKAVYTVKPASPDTTSKLNKKF